MIELAGSAVSAARAVARPFHFHTVASLIHELLRWMLDDCRVCASSRAARFASATANVLERAVARSQVIKRGPILERATGIV